MLKSAYDSQSPRVGLALSVILTTTSSPTGKSQDIRAGSSLTVGLPEVSTGTVLHPAFASGMCCWSVLDGINEGDLSLGCLAYLWS